MKWILGIISTLKWKSHSWKSLFICRCKKLPHSRTIAINAYIPQAQLPVVTNPSNRLVTFLKILKYLENYKLIIYYFDIIKSWNIDENILLWQMPLWQSVKIANCHFWTVPFFRDNTKNDDIEVRFKFKKSLSLNN